MIKVGETYTTKNGGKATIVVVDLKNLLYPVAARYVDVEGVETVQQYTKKGHVFTDGTPSEFDLVLPKNPLDDLPIDTPVWIRGFILPDKWYPYHYAGKSENQSNTYYYVWVDGKTQHSSKGNRFVPAEIRVTKPEGAK